MEEKNIELVRKLVNALEMGLKYLPDSKLYDKEDGRSWIWEECTDEEQEAVKKVRNVMIEAIAKAKKEDFVIDDETAGENYNPYKKPPKKEEE